MNFSHRFCIFWYWRALLLLLNIIFHLFFINQFFFHRFIKTLIFLLSLSVNLLFPLLMLHFSHHICIALSLPSLLCVQHHVCTICERPFQGHPFYERGGRAYCEKHFDMVRTTGSALISCIMASALLPARSPWVCGLH